MKKISILLIIALLSSLLCSCQLYDATKTIIGMVSTPDLAERGTTNGYLYTNEFLGLSYRIDSSWGYYNEEEILDFYYLTQDDVSGYDFYDMLATDTYRTQQLSVYFYYISARQMAMLDMDDFLKDQMTNTEESFISQDFEIIDSEITEIDIDGKKLDAIRYSHIYENVNGYTTQVIFPHKDYLVFITVETYYTDTTAEVLDNFSWLE